MARQRHREPPRCPRRKSPTSLIDSQVVKTTPSVMHKCQAVIVGPQDHEIDLIVAILEIVNTPPRRHIPVGSQGSCRGRGRRGSYAARLRAGGSPWGRYRWSAAENAGAGRAVRRGQSSPVGRVEHAAAVARQQLASDHLHERRVSKRLGTWHSGSPGLSGSASAA